MKTIRMKKADWAKWDAALRSGEYEQAAGCLATPSGFCCLGVLQHRLDGDVERNADGSAFGLPSGEWCQSHGIEFRNCAGQICPVDMNPFLHMLGMSASAANDGEGDRQYTFVEIAAAIAAAVEFTDA